MKLILILSSFFLFSGYQTAPVYKASSKLPVLISYVQGIPPDTIQDFMKVYLQSKKFETLTWDEARNLFTQQIQSDMLALINSGKLNETTAKNFDKNSTPVCNVLGVRIYRDTAVTGSYLIDSIEWFVRKLPVKDTNQVRRKFYPEDRSNSYSVLKVFSDEVIRSQLLN